MEYDADFAAFWALYPNKLGRLEARKAYERARKRATADSILAGLVVYRAHMDPEPRFRPRASTWLRGERWADDYAAADVEPAPARGDSRALCQHEPRCPSNVWHGIQLDADAADPARAAAARRARAERGAA